MHKEPHQNSWIYPRVKTNREKGYSIKRISTQGLRARHKHREGEVACQTPSVTTLYEIEFKLFLVDYLQT